MRCLLNFEILGLNCLACSRFIDINYWRQVIFNHFQYNLLSLKIWDSNAQTSLGFYPVKLEILFIFILLFMSFDYVTYYIVRHILLENSKVIVSSYLILKLSEDGRCLAKDPTHLL